MGCCRGGGHNAKGTGTIESTRLIDVMKLARAGYFTGSMIGSWRWSYQVETTATIGITGGRDEVTLNYRFSASGEDPESICQKVPIRWTPLPVWR